MRREVDFRQRLEAKAWGGLCVPGGPDSHLETRSSGGATSGPSPAPTAD